MYSIQPSTPPQLQIQIQNSRFHPKETKEIDIHGLFISMGMKSLLTDAHFILSPCTRYALLGRNGVGKSILLKSLAYNWIPFAHNQSIYYVEQLESKEQLKLSPFDTVWRSNAYINDIYSQMDMLEKALENGSMAYIENTWLEYKKLQIEKDLKTEKAKTARTSGARGAQSRKKLLDIQSQLVNVSLQDEESNSITLLMQKRLVELQSIVPEKNELELKAKNCLKELGFTPQTMMNPLSELSGGWRIRVGLATALFVDADILLLDEPTNHLDLPAILWLTKYIQSIQDKIVLIVSHDRHFLNETVDQVIVFQAESLTYFMGNYDTYMETIEDQKSFRARNREIISKKKQAAEKSIQQGFSDAKKAKNDKKLAQVASRKRKVVEGRIGMEKNEHGHRFKLNKDRVGYFFSLRAEVADEHVDPLVRFKIPEPPLLTQHGPLMQVDQVSFSYDKNPKILDNVTLSIEGKSKIAFVGANGQGKTTLMNLLADRLQPTQGRITRHSQARIAYFDQYWVDTLSEESSTSLEYMMKRYPEMKEQSAYNQLGSLGIQGNLANQPLKNLSGGQRVRFVFSLLLIQSPHLFLLDEPTNHMDLDAVEALVESLLEYDGAIVFVSHDYYFVERVANTIYKVANGYIKEIQDVSKLILKK